MGGFIMAAFIFGLIFAVVCGKIAEEKGYTKNQGQAMGFFLGIIGWLIVQFSWKDKNAQAKNERLGSADELLKYKQLLDAGAISQAEYDAKKRELMN